MSLILLVTSLMLLSPKATKFGEITQHDSITPFKVIRGHWIWYQSKAHIICNFLYINE